MEFKVTEINAGWIKYSIEFENQRFEDRFSDVYDPIPDFKHWLEAIAIGVMQTSFYYDNEGTEIIFDFDQRAYNKIVFTIKEYYSENIFLTANVERKTFVKKMYESFLQEVNSEKFDKKEWEICRMRECLSEITKTNEAEVSEMLLQYDSIQLAEIFFKTNPSYIITYKDSKSKSDEIKSFIKDSVDNTFDSNPNVIRTPDEYKIPEEYNLWNKQEKMKFLESILKDKVSAYSGTKFSEFRSEIIENLLKTSSPIHQSTNQPEIC